MKMINKIGLGISSVILFGAVSTSMAATEVSPAKVAARACSGVSVPITIDYDPWTIKSTSLKIGTVPVPATGIDLIPGAFISVPPAFCFTATSVPPPNAVGTVTTTSGVTQALTVPVTTLPVSEIVGYSYYIIVTTNVAYLNGTGGNCWGQTVTNGVYQKVCYAPTLSK